MTRHNFVHSSQVQVHTRTRILFEKYLNPKIASLSPNIESQILFIEDTTSRYSDLLHVTAI